MCGLVPFGEECEDPYEVYQLITAQNLHYPSYFLSNKENKLAKKMIERLLNRNSSARLGGSYAALKAHPWFDNFDWVTTPPLTTNIPPFLIPIRNNQPLTRA